MSEKLDPSSPQNLLYYVKAIADHLCTIALALQDIANNTLELGEVEVSGDLSVSVDKLDWP